MARASPATTRRAPVSSTSPSWAVGRRAASHAAPRPRWLGSLKRARTDSDGSENQKDRMNLNVATPATSAYDDQNKMSDGLKEPAVQLTCDGAAIDAFFLRRCHRWF